MLDVWKNFKLHIFDHLKLCMSLLKIQTRCQYIPSAKSYQRKVGATVADAFYDIEPLDIFLIMMSQLKKKLDINHFVSLFHNNRMFHIQPSLPTFVSDQTTTVFELPPSYNQL